MADRYLLESGAPDGYQLEDSSGVLLLEGASFDPTDGFPWPQPAEVPAHRARPRAAALALTACSFVFVPPPVDPSAVPTWLPSYPATIERGRQRAAGLRQDPLSKPPPKFVGSVRLVGEADNNGLRITTNLPGPTNYSVKLFFYVPSGTLGGGDHSVFALEDATPTNYHVLEVSSAGDLFWGSSGAGADFLEAPIQRDRWWVLVIAIGSGAGHIYYKPANALGAMTDYALAAVNSTLTPAAMTFGSNGFIEPFNGRFFGAVVWPGKVLTEAEANAEAASFGPATTGGVSHWWKLESDTTKLLDSSGFGRDLSAKGAGTWTTEEGPLLAPGPLDPALSHAWARVQHEPVPRARPTRPWLVGPLSFSPFIEAAPALAFWQPTFPDQFRRLTRAAQKTGEPVFAVREWGTDWLSWQPSYPSRVTGRASPLRVGGATYLPAVAQWGTDALAWLATFPDRVRGLARAQQAAHFGVVDFGAAPVAPLLSWLGSYPERVYGRARGPHAGPTYLPAVAQWGTDWLSWAPIAPDRAPGRAPLRTTAGAVYLPALSLWGTDSLAWLPLVPERTFARRRPVGEGLVAYTPAVAEWGLDALSWLVQSEQPGRRPRPLLIGGGELVQLVQAAPVVDVSWLPSYPNTIARPRLVQVGAAQWVWVFDGVLPYTFGRPTRASDGTTDPAKAVTSGTPTKART